jgi:hypothetical protein
VSTIVKTRRLSVKVGPVTEDEVFDGVRQLILTGEYRDTRYIQIGPLLPEPPREVGDPAAHLAAFRRYWKHMPPRAVVDRSSAEYAAARDGGLLPTPSRVAGRAPRRAPAARGAPSQDETHRRRHLTG